MSALRTPGFPQVVADLHQGEFVQSNQTLATLTQGMRGVWRDGEIQRIRMLRFGDKCARLSAVFALLRCAMRQQAPTCCVPCERGVSPGSAGCVNSLTLGLCFAGVTARVA